MHLVAKTFEIYFLAKISSQFLLLETDLGSVFGLVGIDSTTSSPLNDSVIAFCMIAGTFSVIAFMASLTEGNDAFFLETNQATKEQQLNFCYPRGRSTG